MINLQLFEIYIFLNNILSIIGATGCITHMVIPSYEECILYLPIGDLQGKKHTKFDGIIID